MRIGPFTPTILPKKRYLLLHVFLIWITIIPILLEFWFFWQEMFHWKYIFEWRIIHFFLFLPIICILMYVTAVLFSIIFTKFILIIVNFMHKPQEGVFLRNTSNKHYRYWCLRNLLKKWSTWLAHKFPFPFMDNICFKIFGVNTKISNSLFEGWVDCEFIDFGKDVVVGQGAIVQSAVIIGDYLIIRKTIIEDNVRIGSHAFVMPGTHIGKNCILAANSSTVIEQQLDEGWIYVGIPAKKFKRNIFFDKGLESLIGYVEDVELLREKYEKVYTKLKLRERMEIKKEKKEEEKHRWEI
ncbi:MAG: acyltransferase [Promethearchaeota archaeon]